MDHIKFLKEYGEALVEIGWIQGRGMTYGNPEVVITFVYEEGWPEDIELFKEHTVNDLLNRLDLAGVTRIAITVNKEFVDLSKY